MVPGGKYSTAKARWSGVGPYFAMFPSAFADRVVKAYSSAGDTVLDPFAGRGTALFSAAVAGRGAIGVEINPVGWIYCKTKLNPAAEESVIQRIAEVDGCAASYREHAKGLPLFFRRCFSSSVLSFLVCARSVLDWRENDVDRTVMAFLLIHLHGKSTDSLSNQMRQTKAMSPRYAVEWWRHRDFKPPRVDPLDFFRKRLAWRYARGTPEVSKSAVLLGDAVSLLAGLEAARREAHLPRPSLMLTSPPYFGITNYHYDQWIRLWLLGGPPSDRRVDSPFRGRYRDKFENVDVYRDMLSTVFRGSAKMLKKGAVVYVRADRREPTVSIMREALREAFPSHELRRVNRPVRPVNCQTQTRLFGHFAPKAGEVDFILTPDGF